MLVFFAGEKPVISDPGEQVLDDVIKSLKGAENYEVVLRKSGAGRRFGFHIIQRTRPIAVDEAAGPKGGVKPDSILTGSAKGNAGQAYRDIYKSVAIRIQIGA